MVHSTQKKDAGAASHLIVLTSLAARSAHGVCWEWSLTRPFLGGGDPVLI